jgi:LacI family transcriptional regulator
MENNRKSVTLRNLAQHLKISTSTISRFLNEDPTLSIGEDKKQLIIDAVSELGYISPKRGKRKQAGDSGQTAKISQQTLDLLIVNFLTPTEEIDDPYFTSIRAGIQSRCQEKYINLQSIHISSIQSSSTLLKSASAIIAVGHFSETEIISLKLFNQQLIFVDSCPLGLKSDSVTINREALASEVVSYMINQKCLRPAFIGNNETRLHVFQAMMKQQGLYRDSFCKVSKEYCIESGYQATVEMLASTPYPDVIYAATDMVAVGVYRAVYEKGLSIPDDVQVIGTNDISSARHMSPSLSTMRLYPFEMGVESVNLFIERDSGRKFNKNLVFGHDFISRGSFPKIGKRI